MSDPSVHHADEPELLQPFDTSGRFRRLSSLGRGAMGIVYEVYDCERDLRLALKELQQATPSALLRFKNEFRSLSDVRHPNLVALDDLFEHAGRWYFTMEVIDGVNILAYVRPTDVVHHAPSARSSRRWSDESDGRRPATRDATIVPTVIDADPGPTVGDLATTTSIRPFIGAWIDPSVLPTAPLTLPMFDEVRLRSSLRQLASGVVALHRADKVHRDLKPSNILVERGGRVVILDFGVVATLSHGDADIQHLIGTAAYMAPEQASGDAVSEATDWYAVGVLLFRALTGHLPFEGTSQEILAQKVAVRAPRPQDLTRDLPVDLAALCSALLERLPAARPHTQAILESLGTSEEEHWYASVTLGGGAAPFVGRVAELRCLAEALRDARDGAPSTVALEGASGVGKSALVAEFVSLERARDPRLIVLHGRCHEREAVPYKAFDGVIDDLARHLANRPKRRPRLTAPDSAALVKLFPSLGVALPGHEPEDAQHADSTDPATARARAFAALLQVFDEVAARQPLVIAIDDIQWADADSLTLMEELTSATPGPAMLIVLTLRTCANTALAHVRGRFHRIALTGLTDADARALIGRLLSRARFTLAGFDRIIEESGGHPMFIGELIHQLELGQPSQDEPLDLDAALRARIARQSDDAQHLMWLVGAAGSPIEHAAIARAAAMSAERYRVAIDQLRGQFLIRISGARRLDTVEPYHDRVREAVYDALSAPHRRTLHARLAESLEQIASAPDVLARHLELGGDPRRAARFAAAAADLAARGMAFSRAAELYRKAIELGEHARDPLATLYTALGHALQNAGRGGQAADAYAAASRLTSGSVSLDLARRTAEQLLMGGHVRAGKAASAQVLASIGLRLPGPSLGTLLRLFFMLVGVRLSRLRWTQRNQDCAPEQLHRVDTCWSVAAGLSMVDTTVGLYFSVLGLKQSLPLGEPFRIARAACTVSVVASALEQGTLAQRTLDLSAEAARIHATPLAQFYCDTARMVRSFLVEQSWIPAEAWCRKALQLWKQAGMGRGFESDFTTQFASWSFAMQGDLIALRRELEANLREARGAGNRFLEVSLRVFHHLVHSAADRPVEGRRDVRDAIDSWLDEDAFQLPHCWHLLSLRNLSIYEGRTVEDPDEQLGWRRMTHSVLWCVGYVRNQAEALRARWELACALDAERAGQHGRARRLRQRARGGARRLAHRKTPITRLWGRMVAAGICASTGDDAGAIAILEPLISVLEGAACGLDAACARRRLGQTVGGDRGAQLIATADRWFTERDVRNPARLTATIIPGWRSD